MIRPDSTRLALTTLLAPAGDRVCPAGLACGETSCNPAETPLDFVVQQSVHGRDVKRPQGSPRTATLQGAKTSGRRSGRWRV